MENNNQGLPPINSVDKPKKNNVIIYAIIIIALLATNIYLFTKKSKSDKELENTVAQSEQHKVENENLQIQYAAALKRLDDLTGENAALDKIIADKDSEVAKMKAEIEAILKNKNASDKDIAKAKTLIKDLNQRILNYENQIVELKKQNAALAIERDAALATTKEVSAKNESLSKTVNEAKVFSVSNIQIQPIELRKKGTQERETDKARRVDILRVKFDINENRVSEEGPQVFYVRIVNPEGKLLTNPALGSGKFNIKDIELPQNFTISKSIQIKQNETIPGVILDWEQNAEYIKGDYSIELYNNGVLVGKNIVELR